MKTHRFTFLKHSLLCLLILIGFIFTACSDDPPNVSVNIHVGDDHASASEILNKYGAQYQPLSTVPRNEGEWKNVNTHGYVLKNNTALLVRVGDYKEKKDIIHKILIGPVGKGLPPKSLFGERFTEFTEINGFNAKEGLAFQ